MYKALDKWLFPWLRSKLAKADTTGGLKHLIFCVADHFEPFREEKPETGNLKPEKNGRPSAATALSNVKRWTSMYRKALGEFEDSDGRSPCHTFFYPAEEYDQDCLEHLADFCEDGFGEVEVQLHHRNDTPAGFKKKIATFKEQLRRLGLLGQGAGGKRKFGFVHGNWSLCNSRPDGDWCGINEELALLQELGCYADFTFPSAPSPTQPRMVNAIYRAVDKPEGRGHDFGTPVHGAGRKRAGRKRAGSREEGTTSNVQHPTSNVQGNGSTAAPPSGFPGQPRAGRFQVSPACRGRAGFPPPPPPSGLMLITGPLGIRWQGGRPRLENGALTGVNPPSEDRIKFWVESGISVAGRPDWIFVKVHMHGCEELKGDLLHSGLKDMHKYLAEKYNDGSAWALHYASAREMYNIARAAECGMSGNPSEMRDFEVKWDAEGE